MAEETVLGSESDPNFAIVCSFLVNHGSALNLPELSFNQLQTYFDDTKYGKLNGRTHCNTFTKFEMSPFGFSV